MKRQIECSCTEHASAFDCPDYLVTYSEKFDEYGLIIHDGGTSFLLIQFCPWCGARLPESRRNEWFERIESLGLEPDERLPEELKSGAWWRGKGF